MSARLDLVTVACTRDMKATELQARSVALYAAGAFSRALFIWNDVSPLPAAWAQTLRTSIAPVPCEVIAASELGVPPPSVARDGWTTQQALKLLASRLVAQAHYVVLDAKNHFISRTAAGDFLAEGVRARAELATVSDARAAYAATYVGGRRPAGQTWILNVTPFVFHRDSVRECVEWVEALERRDLADVLFGHEGNLTEFFLYEAFLAIRRGTLDDFYAPGAPRGLTVWTESVADANRFTDDLGELRGGRVSVCGVHWLAMHRASPPQRRAIAGFWNERGLVHTVDEGLAQFEWIDANLSAADAAFANAS